MRRVAVVTGTRAEYGLLRSLMESVSTHPRLSLQLAVTGMHLLRKFGHTVDEIIQDGWRVDARIKMQRGDDGSLDQADGLSRGVRGIAAFLERAKSDIVVVLGDRIDVAKLGALALAMGLVAIPGTLLGKRVLRHVSVSMFTTMYRTAMTIAGTKVLLYDGLAKAVGWVGASS